MRTIYASYGLASESRPRYHKKNKGDKLAGHFKESRKNTATDLIVSPFQLVDTLPPMMR
jgi:hypothetical protein